MFCGWHEISLTSMNERNAIAYKQIHVPAKIIRI